MEAAECSSAQSNNTSNSCNCSRADSCSNCRNSGSSTRKRSREKMTSPCIALDGEQPFSKLPKEIVSYIFSFLSFDQVAQLRPVCKTFDDIGQSLLTKGFYKLGELHSKASKKIKAHLPRRESERRVHHLALYGDILTGVETRLNLLSMTYGKFIDRNLCCFIPGRVIDEVLRIIQFVNRDVDLNLSNSLKVNKESRKDRDFPREHHEVLQELRDLSSMAMEHFEESIQPRLRPKTSDRVSGGIFDPLVADSSIVDSNDTVLGFTTGFRIATGSPVVSSSTVSIYQTVGDQHRKIAKLEKRTKELQRLDREKSQKLQEYHDRLTSTTASMTKLIAKYTELEKQLAELRSNATRDSGEASTSRETIPENRTATNDVAVSEFQPRLKRSRQCKK